MQVTTAKQNLLLAAQQHPMHGTLLALQYVFRELDYDSSTVQKNFNDWKKVHMRAIQLIEAACDAGMDVLSDPSPEGNVPSDYREDENIEDPLSNDNIDLDGDDSLSGQNTKSFSVAAGVLLRRQVHYCKLWCLVHLFRLKHLIKLYLHIKI
ncbi:hypothetical protein G6F68_015704 [Rhizopus microsporus]|nr:hypothetical protein G6F68_015704 [Rhizopus microsporus]